MIGKNKMKDWKACIRTWEKRQNFTKQEAEKPEWFDKKIESIKPNDEELEELENIMKELV